MRESCSSLRNSTRTFEPLSIRTVKPGRGVAQRTSTPRALKLMDVVPPTRSNVSTCAVPAGTGVAVGVGSGVRVDVGLGGRVVAVGSGLGVGRWGRAVGAGSGRFGVGGTVATGADGMVAGDCGVGVACVAVLVADCPAVDGGDPSAAPAKAPEPSGVPVGVSTAGSSDGGVDALGVTDSNPAGVAAGFGDDSVGRAIAAGAGLITWSSTIPTPCHATVTAVADPASHNRKRRMGFTDPVSPVSTPDRFKRTSNGG